MALEQRRKTENMGQSLEGRTRGLEDWMETQRGGQKRDHKDSENTEYVSLGG